MSPGVFWDMIKVTTREWWNDNTFRMAAALAFYTIFSLAPVVIISTAIAGVFFGHDRAGEQIAREINGLVGGASGLAVRDMVAALPEPRKHPLAAVVGVITLLIGSTVVFAELQSDLNQIWDVKVDPRGRVSAIRRLIRERLQSFVIVLGVGFLLLVSLILSAALASAHDYVADRVTGMAWLWRGLEVLASILVATLLFGMIYLYLPDVKITWRDVSVGALVTALLFTGGKYVIGAYLRRMTIGDTYGAAGSFAVLLIWVYYSALISLFGAEFTQVFARRYGSRIHPEEHAVRVGEKPDKV